METIFLGAALLGAILFIARYLRNTFKEGKSCPSCRTGSSKCNRMVKGDKS
jgi:hypothetical protein